MKKIKYQKSENYTVISEHAQENQKIFCVQKALLLRTQKQKFLTCEICEKEFKNDNALEMHNKSKHYNKSKINRKNIFIGIAIIVVIGLIIFFAMNKDSNTNSTTSVVQKITLGFTNNYNPNTIEVKAGIPVEITLDNSVNGCYRAFTIPALGVSKISRSPSDTIKFTPDKPGIYHFQCGMNMGYGTIIVS